MGWGSSIAVSCGIGLRLGSDPELLWLWCRPATTASIWPLACEPPHVLGAALEKTHTQSSCRNLKPVDWPWNQWKPPSFMPAASWRRQEMCIVEGRCKYQLPPSHSRKLDTSLVNTNGLWFFFFFFFFKERGKMLEVALYTIKLYLCAKTSNWCCSIKYSKHLLPALWNVSQNSESWNFIVLLVRGASHWEQMPSLSS